MVGLLKWVLPALAGGLLGAASAVAALHYVAPANEVYALNVARVVNAERQVLSRGETKGGPAFESAETELFHVNHTLKSLVARYSRTHLVIVKQAIVGGPYIDITDAVLKRLGLPLNTPKVSMRKLLAAAPGAGDAPLNAYLNHQKLEMAQKGAAEMRSLNQNKARAALP